MGQERIEEIRGRKKEKRKEVGRMRKGTREKKEKEKWDMLFFNSSIRLF